MKKKLLVLTALILVVGVIGISHLNYYLEFIDFTSISIRTDNQVIKSKIKVRLRNEENDPKNDSDGNLIIFNGVQNQPIKTSYGENDFLITYDNHYQFKFRHFIFNRHDKHQYKFYFFQKQDTIFIQADIKGPSEMQFQHAMDLMDYQDRDSGVLNLDISGVVFATAIPVKPPRKADK